MKFTLWGIALAIAFFSGCSGVKVQTHKKEKCANCRVSHLQRDEWRPAVPAERRPAQMAKSSWVCEVESAAKVFTGVGPSRMEAEHSAQNSCGIHFLGGECSRARADCRTI